MLAKSIQVTDLRRTVDLYKDTLTRDEKLSHSVDWLTEVIHRFTDAWLSGRDMATVNMQSPTRLEKVGGS